MKMGSKIEKNWQNVVHGMSPNYAALDILEAYQNGVTFTHFGGIKIDKN